MDSLTNLPINVVDIAVGATLLISGVFAYVRGLVHEILSVLGWIGAIAATVFGFPYVKPFARDLIPVALAADLAAGVVIFIAALIALSVLTRSLSSKVQESALNVLDRSLGFVFGLLRGGLMICVAYIGLEIVLPRADHPVWLKDARTMPLIIEGSSQITQLIPESFGGRPRVAPPEQSSSDGTAEQLLQPAPQGERPPSSNGYEQNERSTLERLIEATQ